MYAGGSSVPDGQDLFLQIHTMTYNTGTGLYSQTSWTTNSEFTKHITKLVYEAGTTSYLYYLAHTNLWKADVTSPNDIFILLDTAWMQTQTSLRMTFHSGSKI